MKIRQYKFTHKIIVLQWILLIDKDINMKRSLGILIFTLIGLSVSAIAAPYRLGDTTIDLSISGSSGHYVYIHLHENEGTALLAAKKFLNQHPGKLITVSHHGGRNIRFTLNGQSYQFDPNRIFTSNGLHRTLRAHSANVSPAAITVVTDFANAITTMLGSQPIISLHNNANESIKSYLAHGKFSRDAERVAYFPNQNPHNFFLVTEANKFNQLKEKGYNVVLQDNRNMTDDGSLSVYAAKHGISYVNVEAAYGALMAQINMLNALS